MRKELSPNKLPKPKSSKIGRNRAEQQKESTVPKRIQAYYLQKD
jgi:hypothetical protein